MVRMSRVSLISGSSSASLRGAVAFSLLFTIPLLYLAYLAPMAAVYAFNSLTNRNFHEVIPGKVYRSGSMNPQQLTEVIRHYGIRTVVDLRLGGPFDLEHGVTEPQVVSETGAKYIHAKLRSSAAPTKQRLKRLLAVVDKAETPVLFHCHDGVHRTGFALVLWLVEREGVSFDEAMRQVSLWYGYFQPEQIVRSWIDGEPQLIAVLFRYAAARASTGIALRAWLEEVLYPTLIDDPQS